MDWPGWDGPAVAPTNGPCHCIAKHTLSPHGLIAGGLVLYQIANGGDPVEVLSNAANGNIGVIHQEGNGHNGSLAQGGGGNAGGVFQFGNNTNAHLNQNGGQGDLVFTFGW